MSPSPPVPTLDDVRRALGIPAFDHEQAWRRMAPQPRPVQRPGTLPGEPRPAGVLLLLYPLSGELGFVLTRRTDVVATHKGQVSLPGGAQELGDSSPEQTALRETGEELAICRDDVNLLGRLTPVYVFVSDFVIHPFVGYVPYRPEFQPNAVEVAEVIEVPLATLLDDGVKARERWLVRGVELDVPFYRVGGHAIWGATATILSEFEHRLRVALGPQHP